MSDPTISVVIPVFNGAPTLAEAVASVRAQAMEVEIVIVDDGSTDETPDVIRSLGAGIVHLSQPNSGPAAARNYGVARSRGELIAFLDDDDLWAPGKLRLQCRLLAENPEADVTIGHSEFLTFDAERGWTELVPAQFHYHLGASLCRRTLFQRVGTFAPEMRFSEDIDWFLRARDAGAGIVISTAVVQTIRRNGDNMTRGKTMHQLGIFETLKRSLDRRRMGT